MLRSANLMTSLSLFFLNFILLSFPCPSFPGLFCAYLSTVFFLCSLLSLESSLSALPAVFLLPWLVRCFLFLLPNLVAFLFCSPMGHASVRSGTRVQLWLRRRQLLSCHWRPSHRPSAKALSDLDMWTAQTGALLYCQPPAGEASLVTAL